MNNNMEWRPIDSAPGCDLNQRVLIIGGVWKEPQIVLADGDWWRMRTKEGSEGQPTHWMPLPPAPKAK